MLKLFHLNSTRLSTQCNVEKLLFASHTACGIRANTNAAMAA
jgi:hypothetical protein